MGSVMFTARKMSLQARINSINLELMKLQNKQDKILSDRAAQQPVKDLLEMGVTMGTQALSVANPIAGAGVGMLANKFLETSKNMQAFRDSKIDKQMDTRKQQLTTQLQTYQAELQNVEKAEADAIKKGAPKYVA